MHFIIDENVPKELVSWLKEKRHAIFCVPKGTPDEEIASLLKKQKFILLTQNRHFANSLRFPPQDFSGIIRIKIHPSYIEDITFSLEKVFKIFSKDEHFKGKLLIVEKFGFFKLKE